MRDSNLRKTLALVIVVCALLCIFDKNAARPRDDMRAKIDRKIQSLDKEVSRFVEVYDDPQSSKALVAAVKNLREEFNHKESWEECRDEVLQFLDIANRIEEAIKQCYKGKVSRADCRYHGKISAQWSLVRVSFMWIARYYSVSEIGERPRKNQ